MKNMNNYQKGQSNPQMNNMMMPNNFAMNRMNMMKDMTTTSPTAAEITMLISAS